MSQDAIPASTPERSLPPRPNLDRLKDEARRRQRDGEFAVRADALFAIAREHGFSSWPALKVHVEAMRTAASDRLDVLLDAVVPRPTTDHRGGSLQRVDALLAVDPGLAGASIAAAAATGDTSAVASFVGRDPALAAQPSGPRAWPPLLYACFSRVLQHHPERQPDFDTVVALLLAAGADANASFHNPEDPVGTETALYGASSVVRSPSITRRLLEAGASADDEEVAYHVPAHPPCLAVWLDHAPPAKLLTTALLRTLDFDDIAATRLVLARGGDPAAAGIWSGRTALHMAVDRWKSMEFTELLLAHGADPNKADLHGVTPYALAMRLGRSDIAARLREAGARDELAPRDRYVAACAAGDRAAADAILAADPTLRDSLRIADHWVLAEAAKAGRLDAVALMLDMGFDLRQGQHGYTPLHWAAFHGHSAVVELLLERGADPSLRDPHYHSAAWGWAEHSGHEALGIRLLRAGAERGSLIAAVALDDGERVDALLAADPAAAARSDGWLSPLHVAAAMGRLALMERLVAAGAVLDAPGGDGMTPLERALDQGQDEAAAWLRARGAAEPRVPIAGAEKGQG